MKLGYIIIYVPDVESTLAFYNKIFDFKEVFLHESKEYGELNTGGVKLAFISESLAVSNGVKFARNTITEEAAGFEIAFVTNDVKQSYDHAIKCGAIAAQSPRVKPWGQEVAYLRDLNGVIVEICSPMA